MSQGFTAADVLAYQIRQCKAQRAEAVGVEAEGELQQAIIDECKRRGWVSIYQRMDKPTRTGKGTPDFLIFADRGRVFIVEAKAKGEKLKPAQLGYKLMLEKLGHRVSTCYNYAQFIETITP